MRNYDEDYSAEHFCSPNGRIETIGALEQVLHSLKYGTTNYSDEEIKKNWKTLQKNTYLLETAMQQRQEIWGTSSVEGPLTCEFILAYYKMAESSLYQKLVNKVFSDASIATVGYDSPRDYQTLMSLALENPNVTLNPTQKAFTVRSVLNPGYEFAQEQPHKLDHLKKAILQNSNFSIIDKIDYFYAFYQTDIEKMNYVYETYPSDESWNELIQSLKNSITNLTTELSAISATTISMTAAMKVQFERTTVQQLQSEIHLYQTFTHLRQPQEVAKQNQYIHTN